ncbi:MAG: DUF302 domain-containing protein [Pseudomonadota bacterium]
MIALFSRRLFLLPAAVIALMLTLAAGQANAMTPEGWVILKSKHAYADLVKEVNKAAKANKIGIVTRASATVGAKKVLNKKIPGNMVVGLYHPRFAVRMLDASIAAGIEAPIRVYITENADGTADLSYKTPSHVFAPYMSEGGEKLKALAAELDALFAKLTRQAAGS